LIVTLACIWLAIRRIPLSELTAALSGGNYLWLLPAMLAQTIAILLRAQRWVTLLDRRRALPASIWSQGIGYLFTNLFPLRLGEPARVLAMSQSSGISIPRVAGTALVERLLDVGSMILALLLVLPWMQFPAPVIRSGQVFAILVLFGILGIILLARFSALSFAVLDLVCARFPVLPGARITEAWGELLGGLTPLLRWSVAWKVIALSLLTWLCSGLVFFCAIQVFQPAGLFLEAVFMMASLSLAVAVPSTPGFIGVFQFVGQQALVIPFGAKYSTSRALAISLIAHLIYYALSTLVGILGIWRLGLSFSNLRQLVAARSRSE
jgi:hypothetical protein